MVRLGSSVGGRISGAAIRVAVIAAFALASEPVAAAGENGSPEASSSPGFVTEVPTRPSLQPPSWRQLVVGGAYAGLYSSAAKIGSRLGLEDDFKVTRLESAWIVDVFGHVYSVRQTARAFEGLHRWAGADEGAARRRGAWTAAFGSLLYMETINGFMPGVRFDWLDPISNAAGSWIASEGPAFGQSHDWARRLSLELGYENWSRLGEADDEAGALTRVWHDYPNQRWGIGYGLGPIERPWLRVFGTYGVTSLKIEELRQQWGLGIELKPHHWLAPAIERLWGGRHLLSLMRTLDRDLLIPGLYIQLATFESGPFTQREPFQE